MDIFVDKISEFISQTINLDKNEVSKLIEVPPESKFGDYSFPCFTLSSKLKKNPLDISQEIKNKINPILFEKIDLKGPYVNFFLDKDFVAKTVINKGKTIVVDMSSPNIAKPFGIGHLRSTIIGNSLRHCFTSQGYKVIRINHLGDWGTQFGKLIIAFKKWGNTNALKKDPIKYMYKLYIKYHQYAEKHTEIDSEARLWFKKLEDGDKQAISIWKNFKELSLNDFQKIYDLLGVEFESYSGEAFYNNKMGIIIKGLKVKNLLIKSEGATIVDLSNFNLPPALIQKSDEATLYITRDLAAAIYRYDKYKFDKMIYEVGAEQKLHFQQLFKVLELMGCQWFKDCFHIYHGLYLDQDKKKLATRKGKTIFMEDILEESINKAKKIINKKNPNLKNKDLVAKDIGVGAIIFGDLSNDRTNDIILNINKFLSFDGETGPYIQYTHARACSILRKYKSNFDFNIKTSLLKEDLEKSLLLLISKYSQVIEKTINSFKPNILARYLLDLSQLFNEYYHKFKIIQDDKELEKSRIAIVYSIIIVLSDGLSLLGINSPKEM
ncbi:arginine--tRNA ligase [Candidatus Woesearchaeota archaeon]|nr:arginine--tRNA ligase [Candidatus Woesearchaeota archaeon]